MAQSWALVQAYPRDPRAHFFRGTYLLQRNDAAVAEPEYRELCAWPTAAPTNSCPVWATGCGRCWRWIWCCCTARMKAKKIAAPVCAEADPDPRAAAALNSGPLCPG